MIEEVRLREAKDIARFLSKIDISDSGCWDWKTTPGHYGTYWNQGGYTGAHRFSYELFKEPIPNNLEIDHLCRNPRCVNSEHLEAVTRSENDKRGTQPAFLRAMAQERKALRTHCPQGHLYDEVNSYIDPSGAKRCRVCARTYKLRLVQKKEANG